MEFGDSTFPTCDFHHTRIRFPLAKEELSPENC